MAGTFVEFVEEFPSFDGKVNVPPSRLTASFVPRIDALDD